MAKLNSGTRVYGNLTVDANLTITGSILPSANVTYDLGSPTQRFRSAYFSGNTIYIGDQAMSVATDGTWTFTSAGANIQMGATAPFNPPSANISGNLILGGSINSAGNILANGAVVRSMTVNGTTVINDQTQAASATKILDINNGVFDVAV
jgi:phage baseplate assembly protein gpV